MPTLLYNIFMAKRITWIINDATQVGGIERVICNLSNYFIDNNYKVKIISLNTTSGKAYFNLSSQVAIQHLGYPVEDNLKRARRCYRKRKRNQRHYYYLPSMDCYADIAAEETV